jgi:hypothetical protein
MTAIIETIISRPSLNDVFFFEECYISNIDWGWGINPPYTFTDYKGTMGAGFISTELDISITWEEIERRRSELRPDLIEMLKYKRPLEPINDWSPLFYVGSKGEPPFNPFSLTYTFRYHYETYDQLISEYNLNLKNLLLNFKSSIYQTNNTVVERCFVDGVEIEFKGAAAEIAEK